MGKWEYDFGGEVPVLTVLETLTVEEALEALDGTIERPDSSPGSNLIIDVTRAAIEREYSETQAIAHHLGRHHEEGRLGPLVVIVVAKPHQYGLARQLGVFAEEHGLQIIPCYEFQEALKWASGERPDVRDQTGEGNAG